MSCRFSLFSPEAKTTSASLRYDSRGFLFISKISISSSSSLLESFLTSLNDEGALLFEPLPRGVESSIFSVVADFADPGKLDWSDLDPTADDLSDILEDDRVWDNLMIKSKCIKCIF